MTNPLTDEEIDNACCEIYLGEHQGNSKSYDRAIARAIEAKVRASLAAPIPVAKLEAVYIRTDHLQKARRAPFLCAVQAMAQDGFTPLYAGVAAAPEPAAIPDSLKTPAPPNSLPTWEECSLRVSNSDYIAKRVAEGGYGAEDDALLATELHRFIHEYDDTDPYRSAWFMHRLELLVNELQGVAQPAAPAQKHDWVNCPICGEPDMRKEWLGDGEVLITCTNHACKSNGGDYSGQPAAPAVADQTEIALERMREAVFSQMERSNMAAANNVNAYMHDFIALQGRRDLATTAVPADPLSNPPIRNFRTTDLIPADPPAPQFRVSVQPSAASNGVTYVVCLDRGDRPADAAPWADGRITPINRNAVIEANSEGEKWAEFLGVPFVPCEAITDTIPVNTVPEYGNKVAAVPEGIAGESSTLQFIDAKTAPHDQVTVNLMRLFSLSKREARAVTDFIKAFRGNPPTQQPGDAS